MKQKILFIVNPISGGLNKTFFPSLIDRHLNLGIFDAEIIYTDYINHAKLLAKQALLNQFDIVVAVGGDGTINEIASVLESSGKTMGIIPCGSGNGLARTLKIPLNHVKAIEKINQFKTIKIDVGIIDGEKFINMAGMGFDAHISTHFANSKQRGFKNYIKSTLAELRSYKPQRYQIKTVEKTIEREAFMLSIANSSQYGNNAHIAPGASLTDNLLDICIIKPFPLSVFPILGFRMFSKTAHQSKYVEILKVKEATLVREKEGPIHIDGEPLIKGKNLNIEIKHLALNLIV
ncbi:diacylglycerol kinase family lipid kinase [Pedobacter sp. SD-b]|uniref:Diacylglycerol kinase family lipid kinase n=1 Tax=Pedobacter segetis TaxID=2793069 RepID=A0ABS1BFD5_9SPHI|nr:diacylglycerol kinase family protein [Pedobacter segetis]MBK0381571.1 diacylglycerol kinase family lipid kinase [Pedobacter segetis]